MCGLADQKRRESYRAEERKCDRFVRLDIEGKVDFVIFMAEKSASRYLPHRICPLSIAYQREVKLQEFIEHPSPTQNLFRTQE